MALRGIKVLEFAGLAPGPFCGMVLADFGASVIRIDKIGANVNQDCTGNGKMSIAVNLKNEDGINIIKKLSKKADVLIEPFRTGVMESLGLGPNVLLKENPQLIYARLTGYGDSGVYSRRAGHDINYVAMSGLLSLFGRYGEKPIAPVNLAADFGGGGLMCAFGIVMALLERKSSNLGQVIDCNMVEGTAYLGSWLYRSQHFPLWGNPRGKNWLDTGAHFYETYETKDGKFMAVGALEPQFYEKLLKSLGLNEDEVPQLGNFEESKQILTKKFLEKTQEEWCKIFDNQDACVTPVLSLEEAPKHPHSVERKSYTANYEGQLVPNPAPKLSRTPGLPQFVNPSPKRGQNTASVLEELGLSSSEIAQLEDKKVIESYKGKHSSNL
ncbi:hypothetical protein RN001_007381 [Aquatica leii]|uniref:Alpha-methylacyl-CoA racemase n=1 Tax=Aquatica leii TaxID=1421715 RepID=A0AAN7P2S2_9COLE|nr:hypothetical protein RN001_007381 [Aquatica leii]